MIWSASSVWRGRRVICYGSGPPGWDASIITIPPSHGWSSRITSGLAIIFGAFSNFVSVYPIEHDSFHCLIVQPLCKLLEGYMIHILGGYFFALEASYVCSNVVPLLNRKEHYVFLCELGIKCVVIWTTRQEEFHKDESFSFQTLLSHYKHQIKAKIRSERVRLFVWVGQKVGDLCHVVGAGLTFSLDITGI